MLTEEFYSCCQITIHMHTCKDPNTHAQHTHTCMYSFTPTHTKTHVQINHIRERAHNPHMLTTSVHSRALTHTCCPDDSLRQLIKLHHGVKILEETKEEGNFKTHIVGLKGKFEILKNKTLSKNILLKNPVSRCIITVFFGLSQRH